MDVRTASALYSRLCALADGVDRHVRDLPSTPQRVALEALGQELDAVIDGFVRRELAQPQPPRRSTTEERTRMDDMTLIQLFAQLDAHTTRQDAILARMDERRARQDDILLHHSTMLDLVDDRGRQHTDAMLQISANMARLHDSLDRSMQRLETQQTQLGEILGGMATIMGDMAGMLARMDEHTTMIAQILSQFQQGRNGQP